MTVLITGGTGFLGSHLVHALLKKNKNVAVLKRSISNIWRISDVAQNIKFYDIDSEGIEKAFKEQHIDVVIHTACNYGRNNDALSSIVETNVLFGLRVLECSINFNTDTFFNTDTLLQKYLNVYSLSKKQLVEWLKQESDKIQVINMKLEHMYGPKDDSSKFVPWIIQQLQENIVHIPLTSGMQQRDFVYIDDVVSAYMTVLDNIQILEQFSEFDVGSGDLVSVHDFVTELSLEFKRLHPENITRLDFGALPYRQGELMAVSINIEPLRSMGWHSNVDYKNGIKKILKDL
jgi:nucleoside-diphosphate-sugar epimerase